MRIWGYILYSTSIGYHLVLSLPCTKLGGRTPCQGKAPRSWGTVSGTGRGEVLCWQSVKTNGNQWQRVTTSEIYWWRVTTNENQWHPVTTTNYQLQWQPKDNQPDREGTQGRQEEECARSSRLGRLTFAPRKLKMKAIYAFPLYVQKQEMNFGILLCSLNFHSLDLPGSQRRLLCWGWWGGAWAGGRVEQTWGDKFSTSVFELVLTWSGSGSRRSRCGACEYPWLRSRCCSSWASSRSSAAGSCSTGAPHWSSPPEKRIKVDFFFKNGKCQLQPVQVHNTQNINS